MISPIPRFLGSRDSLDYENRWRSPHAEPSSHSDRKSCSTRREISSPGRGYGCSNIDDIVTPPVYSHPFSERIGHNFPHGHQNRLCDHNSESALRDGRQGAGFAEFCSGPKFTPGACVLVHPLPYPPIGRGYFFAQGSEPLARPQFRIGTSTRSVKGRIRRFPVRRPNSSPGARSRAANAIVYGHPFAQTGITFRSILGIAYKTPIRNRHSEALDAPLLSQAIRHHFEVEKPSFRTPKL
ncbi:hypothetical protein Taro_054944 [Colocasia esculenta]|uniref:Uncharacterized protein n=1 Tax=Colocasia esculenta TaxID=4460 RepID=A0A843XSS3_COLES|nr:hypothetical protein [Colocasia esculenta]